MAKIQMIEGIGPATETKLASIGITTVEGLLEKGASKKGREEIISATGLPASKVLAFVNMADLFRIKGVGSQFAELLKASGVSTVKQLATRNAENLHAKLTEVNAEKKLTKAVPALKSVTGFIELASGLEQVVTH